MRSDLCAPEHRWIPIILSLAAIISLTGGQGHPLPLDIDTPLYETRAVWLATVLQDGRWPLPANTPADEQEAALRTVVRRAHAMGMNTLVFQVIGRGDAMYNSSRLPRSHYIAQSPSIDPLAIAIDEAHALGMELHAWVNVFRIGDHATRAHYQSARNPEHIMIARPNWTGRKGYDIWLNPASARARAWQIGNVMEIVRNYDIDGIQFDYIRYPKGGMSGDFQLFRNGSRGFRHIDDWRRNNVSLFARDVQTAILAEKPWIKIGSAPIGTYEQSDQWKGFWAYSSAFQESRSWLNNGWQDYLAPQLYFSIGRRPETGNRDPSPDYQHVLRSWLQEADDKPIFAGIAAFKTTDGLFDAQEIPAQMRLARVAGADGHIFFRFDHLAAVAESIMPLYPALALPTPMRHRENARTPEPPAGLSIAQTHTGEVMLTWAEQETMRSPDPIGKFVIYRAFNEIPDLDNPHHLHQIVPATQSSFHEHLSENAVGATVYYRVASLSRLGLRSLHAPTARLTYAPSRPLASTTRFDIRIDNRFADPTAVVEYELPYTAEILITLVDAVGHVHRVLADETVATGMKQIPVDVSRLPPGTYFATMDGPAFKIAGPIEVKADSTMLIDIPTRAASLSNQQR